MKYFIIFEMNINLSNKLFVEMISRWLCPWKLMAMTLVTLDLEAAMTLGSIAYPNITNQFQASLISHEEFSLKLYVQIIPLEALFSLKVNSLHSRNVNISFEILMNSNKTCQNAKGKKTFLQKK